MMTGGTLERTPLFDVFRALYTARDTAQVLIAARSEERTFYFERGQLISAVSNREAQLVGELLRTFGLADETVLFSAFEKALAEPGRGLSKALTETGAVAPFVAEACVRALAERILFDSFQWPAGAYTITPLEKPPELPVKFDRTNGSLVLEAMRRLPSNAPVPGPAIDPRSRPFVATDLLLRYQVLAVTKEENEALSRVDGSLQATDITPDPRILARLAAIGVIQFPGTTGKKDDKTAPPNRPEGLASFNTEVFGASPPPRMADLLQQQSSLVWNTYRRIDWLSLYELVGSTKEASNEDLLRAVHERARACHPDHHLKPSLSNARDALETLFKKIRMAGDTFASVDNRAGYDRSQDSSLSIAVQDTRPTTEVQHQVARANYTRARSLYEQEDYYPAYEMVKQSVEFDPEKPEYWILLSRTQRKNPKWVRQSAETMRRATQRFFENTEVWFELAEACQAERNPTERLKALKEVLRIDPGNRRAQSALAEIASMKPGR